MNIFEDLPHETYIDIINAKLSFYDYETYNIELIEDNIIRVKIALDYTNIIDNLEIAEMELSEIIEEEVNEFIGSDKYEVYVDFFPLHSSFEF